MPFLDEDEWQQIAPFLTNAMQGIRDYRDKHNCGLATARRNYNVEATKKFEDITGWPDVHFELMYRLRRSDFGVVCERCSHLLRTPRAKFCANCGWIPGNTVETDAAADPGQG